MSGGVDSSVAAGLLKQQGYDVIGAFMKFWHPKQLDKCGENTCCSYESHLEAQKVARKLGIRLYTLNFANRFKKLIVDDFLAQYQLGLTPNPCIRCNEKVKFGLLLQKARELKIPFIATGHYARVKRNGASVELRRGVDSQKDQSYFLYRLTPAQLKQVLFPVGGYRKPEVRKLAASFGLSTATRRDSQEVCFVLEQNLRAFLKKYLNLKPGQITTPSGQLLGKHEGLPIYTIGQRKGVVGGQSRPYFVLSKNKKKNTLIATDQPADLLAQMCVVGDINWIDEPAKFPSYVKAQIRYRASASSAWIHEAGSRITVKFIKKQRAITPGQSVVFYHGAKVLGGGIIEEVKQR